MLDSFALIRAYSLHGVTKRGVRARRGNAGPASVGRDGRMVVQSRPDLRADAVCSGCVSGFTGVDGLPHGVLYRLHPVVGLDGGHAVGGGGPGHGYRGGGRGGAQVLHRRQQGGPGALTSAWPATASAAASSMPSVTLEAPATMVPRPSPGYSNALLA